MEDFTKNLIDIRNKQVPTRIAPLPPSKSQMSKQSNSQSRYGILSSKIFQPNLRRQNAVKKKAAPPRPPPPNLINVTKSQSVPNFGATRSIKSSLFNTRNLRPNNNNNKAPNTDACLIDLSSPPNSPYAGSGSDGVSINSFGSENSSNNLSASDDIFDPFGLICEEPQNAGFSSFYSSTKSTLNVAKPAVKNCGDDDPFKEIALRHASVEKPATLVRLSNNHIKSDITKLAPPANVKSTFYTKENVAKPLRTTIIRPKNKTKMSAPVVVSTAMKPDFSPAVNKIDEDKKLNSETQIAEVLHDFVAAEDGDLSLKQKEKVQILREVNADWFFGKNSVGEGMFPASFVKILSSESEDCMAVPPNVFVKALYTFHGEVDGDLPIQEGENICVLGKVNDDWLYGEANGLRGQFPANFMENVPSNLKTI